MATVMSENPIKLKVCKEKRHLHAHVKSELNKINETGKLKFINNIVKILLKCIYILQGKSFNYTNIK